MASTPEQRARRAAYMRRYRSRPGQRERIAEQVRARREANLEASRVREAETKRDWVQRRRAAGVHTVTLVSADEFERVWIAQRGVCAICRKPETKLSAKGRVRRLSIDHNHATGRIRALLCSRCNTLLGYAEDDPALLLAASEFARRQRIIDATWAMEAAVGSGAPLVSLRHRVEALSVDAAKKMQEAVG